MICNSFIFKIWHFLLFIILLFSSVSSSTTQNKPLSKIFGPYPTQFHKRTQSKIVWKKKTWIENWKKEQKLNQNNKQNKHKGVITLETKWCMKNVVRADWMPDSKSFTKTSHACMFKKKKKGKKKKEKDRERKKKR